MLRRIAIYFALASLTQSYADIADQPICPAWIKSDRSIPYCADGSLVSEHNPVGAIVITDAAGTRIALETITKVLKASGSRTPLILALVNEVTYSKIKEAVAKSSFNETTKKLHLRSIVKLAPASYGWIQDLFQPAMDADGNMTLRPISSYIRFHPEHDLLGIFQSVVSKSDKICGIKEGAFLDGFGQFNKTHVQGMSGGNIETLPGGICLLGSAGFQSDEDWKLYAMKACNNTYGDVVKVPTSWLMVGHVDEVIKVIRSKKRKSPCDFAVTIASPELALNLLAKKKDEQFYSHDFNKLELPMDSVMRYLCDKIIEHKDDPSFDCNRIKNSDVLALLEKEKDLKEVNLHIQKRMNDTKQKILEKLAKKLKCEPDFIDVPNLFFGSKPLRDKNGDVLAISYGMSFSILPNPTNSITIENTVISPEPYNNAFKRYLNEKYDFHGQQVDYVDTFKAAHSFFGNLHCLANTIHVCRPKN